MKILCRFSLLLVWMVSLNAYGKYRVYDYRDEYVTTNHQNGDVQKFSTQLKGYLHIREIEDERYAFRLVWLESEDEKENLDPQSIHAPFLLKGEKSAFDKQFVIREVLSVFHSKILTNQRINLLSLLQFERKSGQYVFPNAVGTMRVEQSHVSPLRIRSKGTQQFSQGKPDKNISILGSDVDIQLNSDFTWRKVAAVEKVLSKSTLFSFSSENQRKLQVSEYQVDAQHPARLEKDHWFFTLGSDVKTWPMQPPDNSISLARVYPASELIAKGAEFRKLHGKTREMTDWVRNHLHLMKNVDTFFTQSKLDDVSQQKIFAELGYIDTEETVELLTQTAFTGASRDTRFRALMALKNTSARFNEASLQKLLKVGLQATNRSDELVKNVMGMITGTLARSRMERNPLQAAEIANAIANMVRKNKFKTVPVVAAGNMKEAAPQNVVQAVDQILLSSSRPADLRVGAESLIRMGKTGLKIEDFQKLLRQRSNLEAHDKLIELSVRSQNFQGHSEYKKELVAFVRDRSRPKVIKKAALDALLQTDFGTRKEDQNQIKSLVATHKDPDLLKLLHQLTNRSN